MKMTQFFCVVNNGVKTWVSVEVSLKVDVVVDAPIVACHCVPAKLHRAGRVHAQTEADGALRWRLLGVGDHVVARRAALRRARLEAQHVPRPRSQRVYQVLPHGGGLVNQQRVVEQVVAGDLSCEKSDGSESKQSSQRFVVCLCVVSTRILEQ